MNVHLFLCSVLCSMCFMMIGYDNGVIGGLTSSPAWNHTFKNPSASTLSTITAIYEVGAFFGSITTLLFSEKLGRKRALRIGAVFMTIGGVLQATSFGVPQMIIARIVSGLGMGMINSTAPVLQSEVSPKCTRGRYVSANISVLNFGACLAYWVDFGFTTHHTGQISWRFPIALQCVFTLVIFTLSFLVVESPRWLTNHGQDVEALKVVAKLMGVSEDDPAARERAEEISDTVIYEKNIGATSWKGLFMKDELGSRHRLFIACSIQGLQQLGGNNAVIYYGQYVFANSLGFSPYRAGLISGFLFTWFFLASFVPWVALDTLGRKPLIMGSTAFMACLFAILSGVIHQVQYNAYNSYACGIVAAICVFLYLSAFAIGYQATVWCLMAEILPLRIRAKGTALATATNWILNFAVVEFFPPAIHNIGWKVYLVFMLTNAIVVPICYFTYKETKGKSLEEIDLLFGTHHSTSVHDAKQRVVADEKFAVKGGEHEVTVLAGRVWESVDAGD